MSGTWSKVAGRKAGAGNVSSVGRAPTTDDVLVGTGELGDMW